MLSLVAAATFASVADANPPRRFTATGYAIHGRTAIGSRTRPGVVAADPSVLPLGTRIRVMNAGPYSGEYVVEDTGADVKGHEIDIYFRSEAEARRFGRRRVDVEVVGPSER